MRSFGGRERRRLWRFAAVTFASAFGALLTLGPAPASAGPAPPAAATSGTTTTTSAATGIATVQAQAATIARTLQDEGRQLDRLAEQFDRARLNAERVAAEVVDTVSRLAGTDAQLRAVRRIVLRQAIADYVLGGQTARLAFSGGRPAGIAGIDQIARQHAYAASIAGAKQDSLRELGRLRRQMDKTRRQLAAEQRAANADLARVDADRQAAAAAAAAEQKTLNRVKGELAVLVAAQQAQLASQQAARIQAALVARRVQLPAASPGPPPIPRGAPAPTTPPRPHPTSPPTTRWVTTTTTTPPPPPGNTPARGWQTALAAAQAELGKPYQWGAAGPDSFDCSGLTMWSWAKAGVSLPHLAQAQYAMTRPIAIANLLPGDLVFYGTPSNVHHVGIYVGGGTMIDAPETGEFVHYTTIYFDGLLAGGRIID
jgi:peptidoglycan DL-endopeptidase CwlO